MKEVRLRKFDKQDIQKKVEWINNETINKYLHYEIPLSIERTIKWFENKKKNLDRDDYIIEVENQKIGLIGLLSRSIEAEFYICIGDENFQGQGFAEIASKKFLKKMFEEYKELKKIYLYTEVENLAAQNLFNKIGFVRLRKEKFKFKEAIRERYKYSILRNEIVE